MPLFTNILHNLQKENKDSVIPDDLVQINKTDCVEFKEATSNTIRATLNVIVAFPVSMPVDRRISIFRYCEEIISILRMLEDIIEDYHCCWTCLLMGDKPFCP